MTTVADLTDIRATAPERIAHAMAERPKGHLPPGSAKLLIIAADHPGRGALAAGRAPMAMGDRTELLHRCVTALTRPGVHGFLGTADVIEDLTLLGALDGKLVYGSMNRGGLAGAAFEMDDGFTAYDARGIVASRLDGGKMLLRIDGQDAGSARTMTACARAVDDLAEHRMVAMIEPFISARTDGAVRNVLTPDAVIRSITIASGLGRTSAYTWLKLPLVPDMERVMAATTMPALVLGGDVADDGQAAADGWAQALSLPRVRGLVLGRSALFPPDDNVAAAVDRAVGLL